MLDSEMNIIIHAENENEKMIFVSRNVRVHIHGVFVFVPIHPTAIFYLFCLHSL
ncbi:uncharacterized protein BDR25DRAFT_13029 [Lindgomyces ingoldianus]|uniref:Uncharacterized protein n=1 Tax=Lindgomyces ingoldianus TaxID=673940 RepID=A0ACB6R124_9PLEO|nr:uncharacterized protein BDR25DRAFT_13029 [Lindgomyces ingoldianus]KAF2472983.1 hypothetical protein BDR25DRAFT_13029 [Lindgomyces ingoldianus]